VYNLYNTNPNNPISEGTAFKNYLMDEIPDILVREHNGLVQDSRRESMKKLNINEDEWEDAND
jgi:hypothetical protein